MTFYDSYFGLETESVFDSLETDYEKIEYLQDLLISYSTGKGGDDQEYKELRKYFINSSYKNLLPNFVISKRNLDQFWNFIKGKFGTYQERRDFLYNAFSKIINSIEDRNTEIFDETVGNFTVNNNNIQNEWKKALARKVDDPEGAITISRTLLESVLKYILDEKDIEYSKKSDFSELYRKVAKELNLAPDKHNEIIFKQILGGCSGIINGLAVLRNNLGDSHGGRKIKVGTRHSELAVNLACALSIFLLKTFEENN